MKRLSPPRRATTQGVLPRARAGRLDQQTLENLPKNQALKVREVNATRWGALVLSGHKALFDAAGIALKDFLGHLAAIGQEGQHAAP